jgi:hypothetical protein
MAYFNLIFLSHLPPQAGNPFDVLKTRMMATEGKAMPSLSEAASSLYKAQG